MKKYACSSTDVFWSALQPSDTNHKIATELKTLNYTWGNIERKARDKHERKNFVAALSADGVQGSK